MPRPGPAKSRRKAKALADTYGGQKARRTHGGQGLETQRAQGRTQGVIKAGSRQTQGQTYGNTRRAKGQSLETRPSRTQAERGQTQGGQVWTRGQSGRMAASGSHGGHMADKVWRCAQRGLDIWRTRGGQAPGTRPEYIAASPFF